MHRKQVSIAPPIGLREHAACSALLAGFSPLAIASDFSGIVTVLFGIPTLLLLNITLGLMLLAEPSSRTRLWAGILGFPGLFAGFVLWGDAASLFRMDSSLPWGVFYFALYASAGVLLVRHFLRRAAPAAPAGGGGN
jgi:hypothetical protein